MAGARVVVQGLPHFTRALKRYAPEVHKEFRTRARRIATAIATKAKSMASWSTRIPRAIGPTVTNKAVGVRVSKKRAPHGPLYERGGVGNSRVVRHPLFGNTGFWFSEPVRPFLQPAVDAEREDALRALLEAAEEAKRKAGLN